MFRGGLAVAFGVWRGLTGGMRAGGCPRILRWPVAMGAQYMLVGLSLGVLVPAHWTETLMPFALMPALLAATWAGFALGTSLDVRVLKVLPPKLMVPAWVRTCLAFLVPAAGFWVLFPALCGAGHPADLRAPVALASGAVACLAMPWTSLPGVRTIKSVSNASKALKSLSVFSGGMGLLVAAAAMYAARSDRAVVGGVMRSGGWVGELGLSCTVGAIAGMVADALTRDERDARVSGLLLLAVVAVAAGLAHGSLLLAPFVGAVGGMWLINATLRRMGITELVQQGTEFFDRVLLVTVGVVIGLGRGATLGLVLGVAACSVLLLVARMAGDVLGCNVGARLIGLSTGGPRRLFGLHVLPQGSLAIALAFGTKDVLPGRWLAVVVFSVLLSQWVSPVLLEHRLGSVEKGRAEG